MKNLTATLTAALVICLVIQCTQGDKRVSLRFKYEPGMMLAYKQTTRNSWRATDDDSLLEESSVTYKVAMSSNVLDVAADSTAELLDSTTWSWTSRSKEDSTQSETVEKTRVMTLFVQPNGRIIDVSFSSEDKATSVTWLKNYFEQGMPVFPQRELTVEDTWTQTTKVLLPDETLDASTTYKIKSLVREAGYDCAVIEYEGNMIIPIEPYKKDDCERQGFDHVDITGVTYFAYKEGIVVMERQNWTAKGYREKICNGKTENYIVTSQSNIDYRLVGFSRP
ncbi:MAG: hypothetical protein U9R56_04405 [candidate division Zixibacteria bacterium]|nr:hypothetical protein [candidate division Zixibacteria bacterium]